MHDAVSVVYLSAPAEDLQELIISSPMDCKHICHITQHSLPHPCCAPHADTRTVRCHHAAAHCAILDRL